MQGSDVARPSLHHNQATTSGGGFSADSSAISVTIINADVYSNTANIGGGGHSIGNHSVTLINARFVDNIATTYGGGLNMALGVVARISANMSPIDSGARGEASCASDSLPAGHTCSQFQGNQSLFGAAIHLRGATLYMTQTAITENRGTIPFNTSVLDLVDSHIDNNKITLDTVLFRDNTNTEYLISLLDSVDIVIQNSTLFRNAGITLHTIAAVNSVQIDRSIIWGNTEGTEIDPAVVFSSDCNIAQAQVAGSQAFGAINDSSSDPLLIGLGYLSANSPAIDACAGGEAADLDGRVRPIDADNMTIGTEYDRGVFEFDPTVTPTAVTIRGASNSAEISLAVTRSAILLFAIILSIYSLALFPNNFAASRRKS
ncbi:MAG TPA: hypothetical protein ENJ56_02090 [Anaerolineae bacterium]|nr:hypothetical protein [Anaerolineae bacterium]